VPRAILIEELHIHLRVRHGLPERAITAAKRTLDTTDFLVDLRRAVRSVVRGYASLRHVRVTLSR
jgi:hypothetical protein